MNVTFQNNSVIANDNSGAVNLTGQVLLKDGGVRNALNESMSPAAATSSTTKPFAENELLRQYRHHRRIDGQERYDDHQHHDVE